MDFGWHPQLTLWAVSNHVGTKLKQSSVCSGATAAHCSVASRGKEQPADDGTEFGPLGSWLIELVELVVPHDSRHR